MVRTRFRGNHALVLHRQCRNTDTLIAQLERLGVTATRSETQAQVSYERVDVCFFDADVGFDGAFPWSTGNAPIPLIALVGYETRGRLEWMMTQRPGAFLVKPCIASGVLSALVMAFDQFDERRRMEREIAALDKRVRARRIIFDALLKVMAVFQLDEPTAYRMLRLASQKHGVSIEQICVQLAGNEEKDLGFERLREMLG